jgi:hypothetical protein
MRRAGAKVKNHSLNFKEISEAFADGSCDETTIFENRHACQCFGCLGKALPNSINRVMA